MTDNISREQRSKNMKAIRSQSELENQFSKYLWNRGIRFRKNVKKLKGTPDIAIQKYKIVIFIDSCFWHGCPLHFKRPKSNQEFWDKKISGNIERDEKVNKFYIQQGWNLKRIWEHDIKKNIESTLDDTVEFINQVKNN